MIRITLKYYRTNLNYPGNKLRKEGKKKEGKNGEEGETETS